MKLIQITDLHLVSQGSTFFGLDPMHRFSACLDHIEAHHGDANLVVITGDLSETGGADTYADLKARLSSFPLPVRLLLGNHDNRGHFAEAFPDQVGQHGFAHAAIDIENIRIIALDTLDEGNVGGHLCPAHLGWLENRLAEAAGKPVYIFAHHPAGPVHMPALDHLGLAEPHILLNLLKHHGDVRHIFAGHLHRLISGHWSGIPFNILRSTNHQTALDLVSTQTSPSCEAPAYSIIDIRPGTLVIHTCEFPTG